MGRFTTIRGLETPEWEISLALRWLAGELSLAEVAKARGNFNASNSLAWVAPRLKAAFVAGRLVIKEDTRAAAAEEADFRRAEALDKPPQG